jgi:Polyketide cyclase / dehydrase and lipid transport
VEQMTSNEQGTREHIAFGARAEVEITVDVSRAVLWERITDISRVGEWSPECRGADWLETAGSRPRAGDRFAGHNGYGNGFVADVVCVVTAADEPQTFAWVVLDESGDPERPGSCWRYDLLPTDSPYRTLIRQSFEHGPGITGMSVAAVEHQDRAEAVIEGRLDELRNNMRATITAMAAG